MTLCAPAQDTVNRSVLKRSLPFAASAKRKGRALCQARCVTASCHLFSNTNNDSPSCSIPSQASVHIPFLLDGKATCTFRGKQWMDGSLYDFFLGTNSNLLTCDGEAFVVDYVSAARWQTAGLAVTYVLCVATSTLVSRVHCCAQQDHGSLACEC
jgi:hypothetical protein